MADVATSAFADSFCSQPVILVAAPGRVNLIGEHIDYEGYGVLPMALQQSCYIAAGTSTDLSISIRSSNPDGYPAAVVPVSQVQDTLQQQPHSWHKYVLAAVQDVLALMAERQLPPPAVGINLLVHGTIPPGGGLSSSSALVVASAVTALTLWHVPADRMQIAALAARCERHVGTQGGGMDQAISVLAQPGVAMKVDFNPVRAVPVELPSGAAFVVGHCLASSFKADTAASRYNRRVVECRLAAMLMAKQLQPGSDLWLSVTTLQQVQSLLLNGPGGERAAADASASQNVASQQLVDAVTSRQLQQRLEQLLPQAAYTIPQLEQQLGEPLLLLLAASPAALKVLQLEEEEAAAAASNPEPEAGDMATEAQLQSAPAAAGVGDSPARDSGHAGTAGAGFLLQQRARHVFTEAARVLLFQQVCSSDTSSTTEEQLKQLGSLMSASHASCRDDYQCSCQELDDLVAAALEGGALGARLTGAGWGGCMVALVREDQQDQLLHHLASSFYKLALGSLQDAVSGHHLFATHPGGGAVVDVLHGSTSWAPPWGHVT